MFASTTRGALALALALLVGACEIDVGTLNLHLVYAVREGQLPLDPEIVQRIRVQVDGPGLGPEVTEFAFGSGGEHGAFAAVPVGDDRVVTVEGLNSRGGVWSRGVSAPVDVDSGTTDLFLYISVRDRFAAPPTVSDPRFGEQFAVGLRAPRAFHATTELPDGRALVTGGLAAPPADPLALAEGADALRVAERFDATAGAFLREGEGASCAPGEPLCLRSARANHSAVLLGDERAVLVAGGEPVSGPAIEHDSEFLDLATLVFEAGPAMERRRTRFGAAALTTAPGGVLVVGGLDVAGGLLASVEHFDDQGSGAFTALGEDLDVARMGAVVVRFQPRGVLAIGGWAHWQPSRLPSKTVDLLRFTDTGFEQGSFVMAEPRAQHAATLLPEGHVLVCGGLTTDGAVSGTCELLDTATTTAREAEVGLIHPRWGHTATTLPDGRVLIAGGYGTADGSVVLGTGELLDPTGVAKTVARPMVSARAGHTATRLASGLVVLIGGVGAGGRLAPTDYEMFNP